MPARLRVFTLQYFHDLGRFRLRVITLRPLHDFKLLPLRVITLRPFTRLAAGLGSSPSPTFMPAIRSSTSIAFGPMHAAWAASFRTLEATGITFAWRSGLASTGAEMSRSGEGALALFGCGRLDRSELAKAERAKSSPSYARVMAITPTSWGSVLPITAAVAIALFVVREGFDFVRRLLADRRRIYAFKIVLARECELNAWTVKVLKEIFSAIDAIENPQPTSKVSIKRSPNGEFYAVIASIDGGSWRSYNIPSPHRETMAKIFVDVATLDRALFAFMLPAYDGLAELQHLRDMLSKASDTDPELGEESFLQGLSGYGLKRLKEIDSALVGLYKHCSGRNELIARIR